MTRANRLTVLDASETAGALPFPQLCDEIYKAVIELSEGKIICPERQILPFGHEGHLSSLPAVSYDLGVHKLVTCCPQNNVQGLPSIHALVTAWSAETGQLVLQLDGATVTARRTAAVSMVAMKLLSRSEDPRVTILGTGVLAEGHLHALATIYPGAFVQVVGRSLEKATAICKRHDQLSLSAATLEDVIFDDVNVVIAVSSASEPIYQEPARPDRLLIGAGAFRPDMAEYAPAIVGNSQLFIDNLMEGRLAAGDFIQAGVDWSAISTLADAIHGHVRFDVPRLFKSVGASAWDLAAVRCALKTLSKTSG